MRDAIHRSAVLACSVCCAPLSFAQQAKPADVRDLDGRLYHVQGVDLDGKHIWVTSVDAENHKDYLHQFTKPS